MLLPYVVVVDVIPLRLMLIPQYIIYVVVDGKPLRLMLLLIIIRWQMLLPLFLWQMLNHIYCMLQHKKLADVIAR